MLRYILMIALGIFANLACARSLALRQTKASIKSLNKAPLLKIIDDVVIREKKNSDFVFLSTIIYKLLPNQLGKGQLQRYVLNADAGNFAGTYIIIGLKRSLEDLMGTTKLTLRYLNGRSLSPQEMNFNLDRRCVADQRQIWIRLDPGVKVLAWDISIDDGQMTDHFSSMMWNVLFFKEVSASDLEVANTSVNTSRNILESIVADAPKTDAENIIKNLTENVFENTAENTSKNEVVNSAEIDAGTTLNNPAENTALNVVEK